MEFKQLEAFVAVVDYGSFSEAARKLYLTQPTISAHVRSLEEELHTKLIIRTTKKTTITTKGYQLYDSAVRMLEIRNNLLENFTGVQKHMIDLATSTIPSSYLLPEILAAMKDTDVLMLCADHGNDPTIGHSHHTREVVPVLVYQQGLVATQLGVRTTLSDVGATVCEFFRAPPPQNGRSLLSSLRFAGDTL